MSFYLWEDGTICFDFMVASGDVTTYRFSDPGYVLGISEVFHKGAHLQHRVLEGEDFETVADECGGTHEEDRLPTTGDL